MIVYVASYPRSGNFWLQTLLGNQFKRITTNIHVERKETDKKNWPVEQTYRRWYGLDVYRKPKFHTKQYPEELAEWFAWYKIPGFEGERPFLIPGCKDIVNKNKFRQLLAEDEEYFFLKTHFLPYNTYFPGEFVIQVVRNPGAVIWSFYNFKKNVKPQDDVNLTAEIKGDKFYGSWSEYHRKWVQAAEKLQPRYLLIRYESLKNRELEVCEEIKSYLGLPILSTELRSFEYYHKMRPALTRKGESSGWEENYSVEQLKRLWKEHQKIMVYYGYPEPQYHLGLGQALY